MADYIKTIQTADGPKQIDYESLANLPDSAKDGGYYIPAVTQPSANIMRVSYAPSDEGMPAAEPVDVTLPAGPSGKSPTVTVSRNADDTGAVISAANADGSTSTVEVLDGKNGKDGDPGTTPNIQIGTVETLPAGSEATASMGGTAENPLLNLGIPRGADGGGTSEREWELLGEIDLSTFGGGSIELTGLDDFTHFYCTWDTIKNESDTASGYALSINNIRVAVLAIPINSASLSTAHYGWVKADFDGLIWQVQRSAGATLQTNINMQTTNALFSYNHILNVGKAVTFKLVAPLQTYQAVSGIIKIYGR